MPEKIKIIGNVQRPSRYNPDLAQKLIEEERLEQERIKKDKAAGKKENSGKVAATPGIIPEASSLDDYILLKDISCVDADGKVFESYTELYVRKNIFRDGNNNQINLTPYQAILHCEQNGLFLPSFALSCNILAALYKNKSNAEVNAVLMQYKDMGNGYGWHTQNTIVNWGTEQLIHYPVAPDFDEAFAINHAKKRIAKSFSKSELCDNLLEEALKVSDFTKCLKNLTGLEDPSILIDIGKYFKKPARVLFPWSGRNGQKYNVEGACWFGCGKYDFNLHFSNFTNNNSAFRGIRKKIP